MRWVVAGADRTSGEDVHIFVEALTEEDARKIAGSRNVVVSAISPMVLAPPILPAAGDRRDVRAYATNKQRTQKYTYKMVQMPMNVVSESLLSNPAPA
jgi:hypothetical protein